MSHQLTVYVIDDDLSVRRFLGSHLGAMGAEAWPFASGAEFLDMLDHLVPACILLDMEMPRLCGLDVLAELARRGVDWPVIGLSARNELAVAVEAMKRGAIDFLRKPVSEEALDKALGPAWVALEKSIQTNQARRDAQALIAKLTPRERDTLAGAAAGQATNRRAPPRIACAPSNARAHIMAKLGVKMSRRGRMLAARPLCGRETPYRSALAPIHRRRVLLSSFASEPPGAARRELTRSAA